MAALPTLLPLSEAARKYGISQARLKSMIEHGTIKAAMMMDTMVVEEDEVRAKTVQRKEDLPEYRKHAHLRGVGIGIAEAADKYNVGFSTIFRWFQKGFIAEVDRITVRGGEKIFLDECDVAYCVDIYRKIGGQGRRIFDKDGMPYKPKTGQLSKD